MAVEISVIGIAVGFNSLARYISTSPTSSIWSSSGSPVPPTPTMIPSTIPSIIPSLSELPTTPEPPTESDFLPTEITQTGGLVRVFFSVSVMIRFLGGGADDPFHANWVWGHVCHLYHQIQCKSRDDDYNILVAMSFVVFVCPGFSRIDSDCRATVSVEYFSQRNTSSIPQVLWRREYFFVTLID